MVLDRRNKICYAALSPRTSYEMVKLFCNDNGYFLQAFKALHSVKGERELIYHTNVMMWIGEGIAAISPQSIGSE